MKTTQLVRHISTYHTISCWFCDHYDHDEEAKGASIEDAAQQFYKAGWREVASDKFKKKATACPLCANKGDHYR